MLQAGKLDKRIAIDQLTVAKGTTGGMKQTWAEVCAVWASVRNMSGNEKRATSAGGGQMAEARTEFTIRYRSGISVTMRVRYGGRLYNIRHVNDWMEKHERLVLTCDTGVNDG